MNKKIENKNLKDEKPEEKDIPVNDEPTPEPETPVQKPTFAERMKARKREAALDKQLYPEDYTLGARVKRLLPWIGTAVGGIAVGALGTMFLGGDSDDSTVKYVDMTDEVEE